MSTLQQKTLDTPLGPLRLVASEAALLGVYFDAPEQPGTSEGSHALLDQAAVELQEYFSGSRERFTIPLAFDDSATPFQREVWTGLQAIPFGETRSYGELAKTIDRPSAVRAVGAANGRNPLSIIVPCHRVIGSDGSLTGYAGGMQRKRWLLDHESRAPRLPGV